MPAPNCGMSLTDAGRWTIRIIKRSDIANGFQGLPRRQVAGPALAWPG
jgi:putative transposase